MALVDDAEEFAHLDRDEDVVLELEPGRDLERSEGEDGDGGEQEADEDVVMAEPSGAEKRAGKREISAAEVRKALQEVARGERVRISTLCFADFDVPISRASLSPSRNIVRSTRGTCPGWTKSWQRQTKPRRRTCAYA